MKECSSNRVVVTSINRLGGCARVCVVCSERNELGPVSVWMKI